MFIIQGTWVSGHDEEQTPFLFIWIERNDEYIGQSVAYNDDVIDNLMYGLNAIIGERHQLILNSYQLSVATLNRNSLQRISLPETELQVSGKSLEAAAEQLTDNDATFETEHVVAEAANNISGIAIPMQQGSIADVVSLLVSFNNPERWMQWGFKPGETTILWRDAALLTLHLLYSEHYIPSVAEDKMMAVWDAVIDEPRIEHRLNEIIASIDEPYKASAATEVQHFIAHSIDGFIRESLDADKAHSILKRLNPRYVAALTPTEHWLQGLFAKAPDERHASLAWIASDVAAWRQDIVAQHNDMAFRTCFRLTAPEPHSVQDEERPNMTGKTVKSEDVSHEAVAAGGDGIAAHRDNVNGGNKAEPLWTLQVLLQATDDPSLLVPAMNVWQEASATLHYLNYRFAQPQERLLADLGLAQTMFSPIQRLLEEKHPAIVELTTAEAYEFLSVGAEQLSDSGFGVFVPTWWRNPAAQLGVKMKVNDRGFNDHTIYKQSTLGFNALLDYEWQLSLGDEVLTLSELEQLAALKEPLIQHKGHWIEFQSHYKDAAAKWLNDKGKIKLADLLHIALSHETKRGEAQATEQLDLILDAGITDDVFSIHGVMTEGSIKRMIDGLADERQATILPQPSALQGDLRPYQFKGFSWLVSMRELNLGICLADDMGLGKTIQYIAYLLYIKSRNLLSGPALLVCPTSVLGNWELELQRFAPSLTYWLHHGPDRLDKDAFATKVNEGHIVVTTYAMIRQDEAHFLPITWDHLTLDEAQYIKNPTAKQTQSIRKLNARHRMALTGTPIENRLSELWSIMDFLNPGYLGTQQQFAQQFEVPIERHDDQHKARVLQRIIQPFLLRRLKSDRKIISDLPDKNEIVVPCTLTKEQVSLYEACIQSALSKVERSSGIERRGAILATITHLKQICNHPAHYLGENALAIHRSGKLMKLVEKLDDIIAKGERVLIFTQYAKMSVLLQQCLSAHYKQEVALIHGQIAKPKRDALIRRFQGDEDAPAIFVLSLKTGGFGLNLTRANHVIHYDRWWNPAVENQATDRAFRIGQQRHVHVHKFICVGTLEERIEQMMLSKQSLAANVVGKGDRWMTEMSNDELKELMSLRHELFQ